jgi:hypothetical protein
MWIPWVCSFGPAPHRGRRPFRKKWRWWEISQNIFVSRTAQADADSGSKRFATNAIFGDKDPSRRDPRVFVFAIPCAPEKRSTINPWWIVTALQISLLSSDRTTNVYDGGNHTGVAIRCPFAVTAGPAGVAE